MGGYNLIVEGTLNTMLSPWNLWVTWFTYVLFIITIIFGTAIYAVSKYQSKYTIDICLIFISGVSYVLSRKNIESAQIEMILRQGGVLYYLPYFFFGALLKRNSGIWKWLEVKRCFWLVILILTIISFYVKAIPLCAKNVVVILTVYYICKRLTTDILEDDEKSWLNGLNKKCIGFLSVLGQHSLEIYFVHFLMLFCLPPILGSYLNELSSDTCWWGKSSASFVEFCIVGSISSVIAIASIILAKIIGQIPYINLLLFGKK